MSYVHIKMDYAFSLDHFPWFVKFYYWLGLGSYLPAFRKLKTVITDCIKERRQKARANKVVKIVIHK